jgi:ATP-dependent Clp protease ATP-binding subunit ClpB
VVTDEAKEALAAKGFDPAFGARPLKRLIQREIGDRLALAVLEGRYLEGDTVTVDIEPDLALSPPGETVGDKTVDNSEGAGETAEQMPEVEAHTFVLR